MNPSYFDLQDENSYHMLLLGICLYIKNDFEVLSNHEHGKGRSDLRLKSIRENLPLYVIEIKHTKKLAEIEELAKQAVSQITMQCYDAELVGDIIYLGLAHCGKDVAMKWQFNMDEESMYSSVK